MGDSTCVSCGECVQACPTGALMESNLLDEKGLIKENLTEKLIQFALIVVLDVN